MSHARALLSPDERERAGSFRFQVLRDNFVLSRGVLRVLLALYGCGAAADLRFTLGRHGKPALDVPAGPRVEFNISHSRDILACAFTHATEVGVDVEYQRAISDYLDLARRFFSPAEVADLMSVDEAHREAAFYDCWVRKEAFLKALGGGLSVPLDSFRVSLLPGRHAALLERRESIDETRAWTLSAFSPAPRFSGAIACRARDVRVHVHGVDAADVFAQL